MNQHPPKSYCTCPDCTAFNDADNDRLNESNPGFLRRLRFWLVECFGEEVANDKTIRNHRFFEEACELVQSCNMTRNEAHALVDAVFDRSKGVPFQEVGGVGTTLGALCLANGIQMATAFNTELFEVWGRIPKIRARQSEKLRPIPGDPPRGGFVLIDYTNYKHEQYLRTIVPRYIRFGTTPYHAEPQWLLEAVDVEKGPRTYALRDLHSWTPYPDSAPIPEVKSLA